MPKPIDIFVNDVKTFVVALQREGMQNAANHLGHAVKAYEAAANIPSADPAAMDWARVEAQLEARAGAMHQENSTLSPQLRATPFGVMTGTATIVLSMIADALRVGMGHPPDQNVEQIVAMLRADRTKIVLDRAAGPPPDHDHRIR